MGSTCFNWFCDRTIVKPIMCEESLSSLFFLPAIAKRRQSLHFWSDRNDKETRPKGFRGVINVYPLVGFFEEKPTGKHLSATLVAYKKIIIS